MVVWTAAYRAFKLGGNPHQPVGTDIDVGERFDLGGGYFGYVVVSPISGNTFVAEAETGAFVGPALTAVRQDIELGDPDCMREQIEQAKEQRKTVSVLPPDEFWAMFRS